MPRSTTFPIALLAVLFVACSGTEPPTPQRDAGPARDAGTVRDAGDRDAGDRDAGDRDAGDRDAGPRDAGPPRDGGVPVPSAALTYLGRSPLADAEAVLRITSDGVHAEISNDAAFDPQRSLCAALTASAPACAGFAFTGTATRTADPCDDTPGSTQPCSYDVTWDLNVGLIDDCGLGPASPHPRRDDCARVVFARVVDAIGQTSAPVQLELVLDTRSPEVTTMVALAPNVGVVLPTLDVATIGSTVSVALDADEPLEALPATIDATNGADVLTLTQITGSASPTGATYAAQITAAFAGADGTYAIAELLEDRAGNTVTATAAFQIATSAPTLLVDQDQVSYVRAPHVNLAAEDLGSFTIPAGPARYTLAPLNELEDVAALPPDTFALASGPAAAIRVFAEGVPVSGWILSAADGSWSRMDLALAPSDAAYVDVVAIGASEVPSQPVRIERSWYVASSADLAASPHTLAVGDGSNIGAPIVTSSVAARDTSVLVHTPDDVWHRVAERHNPHADTFPTLTYDAQRDRLVHTVVWTDEAVWEWDGSVWSDRTPVGPRPYGRQLTSIAYDAQRGETVLFGGDAFPARDDTWMWNGTRWLLGTPTTPPAPRGFHAMAYHPVLARVVLFAGFIDFGVPADRNLYSWDGTNWSVIPTTGAPARTAGHSMAFDVARQELVVFGGGEGPDELWTLSGGTWSLENPAGPRPSARTAPAMAYDAGRGVVVLVGGYASPNWLDDVWEWDGTSWTEVTSVGPRPEPRESAAMVYHAGIGRVVLYGGNSLFEHTDLWTWDGVAWTDVTPVETSPVEVDGPVVYDAARLETLTFDVDETWVWDGNAWNQVAPGPPSATFVADAAYDAARGHVAAFGTRTGSSLVATWAWDGTSWTDITPATGARPPAQFLATAYDAARGVTLLFDRNGDTWTWDGAAWTDVTPVGTNPPSRLYAALGDDPVRERVVLYGGNQRTDTWEWDGSTWTQVVTANTPPERGKLAYDPARRELVLFAGSRTFATTMRITHTEVWAYDGTDWSLRMPSVGRVPRARHVSNLVFDDARSRFIVHGGSDISQSDGVVDDTWELALPVDPRTELSAALPSNVSVAALEDVRVRASCGGSFAGYGVTGDGAALYVLTGTTTTDLGANTTASPAASSLEFAPSIADAATFAQAIIGGDGRARIGCRANLTTAAGGDGAIAADYLEVRWRY